MTALQVVGVATARPYEVTVGPGALAGLERVLPSAGRVAVVTDAHVAELHGHRLGALTDAPTFRLPRGEAAKELPVLGELLEFLAASGLDRRGTLVTLGGGSVGDLGGLAAALYMRGIDVVHAPTTLLAQVDASVGGKTAVNLSAGKNLAGAFHQPRAVLADTDCLATLPEDELRSGRGEVLKTWLVDANVPDELELPGVVAACVRAKARVVAADEREGGERKKLNLGHTFGHALERVAGYGRIPHGVAVATGLALALDASRELGILADEDLPERLHARLAALDLPTGLGELARGVGLETTGARLVEAMETDKKGRARGPALVLVRARGDLVVDVEPGRELVAELLDRHLRV